jgi:hypothetical protein
MSDERTARSIRLSSANTRSIWTPASWWRPIHPADTGDTATRGPSLEEAQKNLAAVSLTRPSDQEADKGYHSRDGLKGLDGGPWKTRIADPRLANGYLWSHGETRRARRSVPTATD